LHIPPSKSTKVVVEDQHNTTLTTRFDVRSGSEETYKLMHWLVQRVRAYEAKPFRIARRQFESSCRIKFATPEKSRVRKRLAVRERLAVQVLIRNAVGNHICTSHLVALLI
jgi:hypothetical protein